MIRSFLRFIVAGGTATSAHYAIFWLCISLAGISATVASAVGYMCGSIVSYLMSYYYAFDSKRSHRDAVVLFYLMVASGFVINTGVVYALDVGLGWSPWLAQVCATSITLFWNFFVSKMYIFVWRS